MPPEPAEFPIEVKVILARAVTDGGVGPWSRALSVGARWLLDVGQHADYEGQQLLQRVEARRLARHQVLDAAVIGWGAVRRRRAKLHDKGPVGRQSRLG
jgi:hypothetical protein